MNALGESPPTADPHLQQSSLLCCLLMEAEAPKCPKAPGLGSLLSEGRTAWGLPVETSRGSNSSNIWTYLPPGAACLRKEEMRFMEWFYGRRAELGLSVLLCKMGTIIIAHKVQHTK